jgi:hypoxanthine phosphoribosyltransferase
MQQARDDLVDILGRSELLHSRDDVEAALDRMAEHIEPDLGAVLGEGDLLVMPVMKGGMFPAAGLMTRLGALPITMDYMHATRYQGGTEGGELAWRTEPSTRLEDRVILVVDDIFDHGRTLAAIVDYCRDAGAAAVHTAVLLLKRRDEYLTDYRPDYVGLEVEDRYVFGCGMDYREYFRGLPEVRALVP